MPSYPRNRYKRLNKSVRRPINLQVIVPSSKQQIQNLRQGHEKGIGDFQITISHVQAPMVRKSLDQTTPRKSLLDCLPKSKSQTKENTMQRKRVKERMNKIRNIFIQQQVLTKKQKELQKPITECKWLEEQNHLHEREN